MEENKRAGLILTMGVLLLVAAIIYLYMVYTGAFSSHFQNQNYNEFACKYMRENQEAMSVDGSLILTRTSPFETGLGMASCGLVLPTATNNTGNITALLRNYSQDACAYGNNNSFKEFVWVRSLPVNITDSDLNYTNITSGPPGMDPCYLIWRINTSYVDRWTALAAYASYPITAIESRWANGTIKRNVVTSLRIDYFAVDTYEANAGYQAINTGTCDNKEDCVGVIEIWGMPQ